jgi:hypothetical protein
MVTLSNISLDFSYNNLIGPISTSFVFKDAPATAYVGNSGLCGDVKGLTHCYIDSRKKKHSNTSLIVVLIPICGLLVLFAAIVAGFITCYQKTKLLEQESRAILECEEKAESLIWGRDGKFTFKDIVKATENFH